jgi:hypothetical protein
MGEGGLYEEARLVEGQTGMTRFSSMVMDSILQGAGYLSLAMAFGVWLGPTFRNAFRANRALHDLGVIDYSKPNNHKIL